MINEFSRKSAQQMGIYEPSGLLNPAMSPTNPNLTVGDQFDVMMRMMPMENEMFRKDLALKRDQRAADSQRFAQEQKLLNNEQEAFRMEQQMQEREAIDARRRAMDDQREAGIAQNLAEAGLEVKDYIDEDGRIDIFSAGQALGKAAYDANVTSVSRQLRAEQKEDQEDDVRFKSAVADYIRAGGDKDDIKDIDNIGDLRIRTAEELSKTNDDIYQSALANPDKFIKSLENSMEAILNEPEASLRDFFDKDYTKEQRKEQMFNDAASLSEGDFVIKYSSQSKGETSTLRTNSLRAFHQKAKFANKIIGDQAKNKKISSMYNKVTNSPVEITE